MAIEFEKGPASAASERAAGFAGWPTAALLVVLVIAVYSPTLQADFVNWDDQDHVSENLRVTEPGGLIRSWYDTESPGFYPITYTTFYVEWRAAGGAPWLFHLDNVLLHSCNMLMVALLARRLGLPGSAAWLVAALWALHPVGVASVAWVTERKNVLYVFFWLGSLLLYLRWADGGAGTALSGRVTRSPSGNRARVLDQLELVADESSFVRPTFAKRLVGLGRSLARSFHAGSTAGSRIDSRGSASDSGRPVVDYVLSVGCFGLALLSKGAAMSLPAALVLVGWLRGRLAERRFWLSLVPHAVLAIVAGMALVHAVPAQAGVPSLGTRLLLAARALWFYVAAFLWPGELLPIYPRWTAAQVGPPEYVSLGALGAAAALAVVLRSRLPRLASLGIGLFLTNAALVVGVVWFTYFRHSWVADHLAYLPSLGLALVGVVGVREVCREVGLPESVPVVALAVWCGALGVVTWSHVGVWRDSETLWTYTLARNPECSTCHANLGFVLFDRGDVDGAIAHYREALRLGPEVKTAVNFGNALLAEGRLEEAATLYMLGMRLDPNHVGAAYNFANALHKQGKIEEAITGYRLALKLEPRSIEAHNNLGVALLAAGRVDEARTEFEEALRLDPEDVEAELNLGVIASGSGRWEAAVEHYEHALRRHGNDPRYAEAHYRLGEALAEQGKVGEAMAEFEAANRLAGGHAESLAGIATILVERGDLEAAARRLSEALRLDPDAPTLHYRLADVLGDLGDKEAAVEHLRRAAELAPESAELANHLAWVLATAPETHLRDGEEAVRLAERACGLTGHSDANYLDTLAAAYAEAGRFADAVRTSKRAIGLAGGDSEVVHEFRNRRSLYEKGEPYREP